MSGQVHGERLKAAREAKGLRQRDVADALIERLAKTVNYEGSTISKWEGNRGTRPPIEALVAMADIYGVSTDYLLGRTEAPDMVVLDSRGRATIVEVKSTVGAVDHEALLDQAAAAAQQVADAMGLTTERKPRRKRA